MKNLLIDFSDRRWNQPLRNNHLLSLGVVFIITWKNASPFYYYISVVKSYFLHMLQSKQHNRSKIEMYMQIQLFFTKLDIKEICRNLKPCHFSHYNFLFGKHLKHFLVLTSIIELSVVLIHTNKKMFMVLKFYVC